MTISSEQKEPANNLLTGSLAQSVVRLAVPVSLGMLLEAALYLTDFFWIGKLGPAAQDAAATALIVQWTLFTLFSLITVGLTALVARSIGAGDTQTARQTVERGIVLAICLGLFFLVLGLPTMEHLLTAMGATEPVNDLARPFLACWLVASPFFVMIEVLYASYRAVGKARFPALIGTGVVVLNLGLTPLLMFGPGFLPEMGMMGASIATSLSVIAGFVVIARDAFNGGLGFQIRFRWAAIWPISEVKRLIRISIPITAQQLSFVAVYWFLIRIVHDFGSAAGAAMGIGNRIESFSYLTCHGFSVAAATLVGQNLGAGNPNRAAGAAWTSTWIAVCVTGFNGLIFWIFADQIVGLFSQDIAVRAIARDYLFILAISQFAMAVEIVIEGAFSGAGDTLPPMLVMIPGALLRIPLAWWFSYQLDWGVSGVWWTLSVTTLIKASMLAYWFSLNHWKQRTI